ncbi:MAG TPA: hypothetical protein VEC36_09115 [Patescibacteria group bacterium]|nr:hypothetical protein [Patescibacteria group bacterium]
MEPSFSSIETYSRLEAFGEDGRQMYKRTILSIDLIFPLSVFFFLYQLGKYCSQVLPNGRRLTLLFAIISLTYLGFDLLENSIVLVILSYYPYQLEFLAGNIGIVTIIKRIAMMSGLIIPFTLLSYKKIQFYVQSD